MNRVVTFPGRFQPFGPHHYIAYDRLCKEFGKDSVYIVTSDKVSENSPFSFEMKKRVIEKYNIDPNKIILCKEPYKPIELLNQFPKDTEYIAAVGQKDYMDRKMGGNYYYQSYELAGGNYNGYPKNGYYYMIPNCMRGNTIMSSSLIRELLKTRNKRMFEKLSYWSDDKLFNELCNVINKK